MSTRTDRTLAIASFILALGLAVAGVAKSYFVTPVRIDEIGARVAEQRAEIKAVQQAAESTREMLGRIDERTKNTDATVQKIEQRLR